MDYHELQVKLANRDKELCSKPITTGSKRAKTHTQYESAEKHTTKKEAQENAEPAIMRGKTYDLSPYYLWSVGVCCSTVNTNCIHPH